MTVQKPHSWIIGFECNGQVASTWQKRDVSSWGVVKIKCTNASIDVVRGCALSKNDKIVTVEMHRMGDWNRIFEWEIREALLGNDKVDVALCVILRDNCVLLIERGVVEV